MKRLLVALAVLLTACGHSSPRTTVTVFAASSLTDVFRTISADYEKAHPGTSVTLSFAGSPTLVAQVLQGAPADVLATADEPTMQKVRGQLREDPRVFARNRLAVICRRGTTCRSLQDLTAPGLRVVLGAPAVPIGRATRAALAAAGVTVHPVSLEPDVRSVLQKVRTGEADAAVVYATDLAAAGKAVSGTALPAVATSLPVGALDRRGQDFAAYLLGPAAQQVLRAAGFAAP